MESGPAIYVKSSILFNKLPARNCPGIRATFDENHERSVNGLTGNSQASELEADRRWRFDLNQSEQAADEPPYYPHPIFDTVGGALFSKWNRNLSPRHRSSRACRAWPRSIAHTMWLEPGDLQITNSHVTLHSRTDFVDHDDPARKPLLFRLWLAPPDGALLPESWRVLYRAVEPATVRGGITGQHHDEQCKTFERRQAAALGMNLPG